MSAVLRATSTTSSEESDQQSSGMSQKKDKSQAGMISKRNRTSEMRVDDLTNRLCTSRSHRPQSPAFDVYRTVKSEPGERASCRASTNRIQLRRPLTQRFAVSRTFVVRTVALITSNSLLLLPFALSVSLPGIDFRM